MTIVNIIVLILDILILNYYKHNDQMLFPPLTWITAIMSMISTAACSVSNALGFVYIFHNSKYKTWKVKVLISLLLVGTWALVPNWVLLLYLATLAQVAMFGIWRYDRKIFYPLFPAFISMVAFAITTSILGENPLMKIIELIGTKYE